MKNWKINTPIDLSYYIRKEIEENKDSKGYWKQSIVCKIAYYECLTMKAAWECFKMYLLETETIDINEFREIYDRTFKYNNYCI